MERARVSSGKVRAVSHLPASVAPSLRAARISPRSPRPSLWAILTSAALAVAGTVGGLATLSLSLAAAGQAVALAFALVALIGGVRIQAPPAVKITSLGFLLFSSIAAFASFASGSAEYALRGTLGLVAAPFAAIAVAVAVDGRLANKRKANRRLVLTVLAAVSLLNAVWAIRQSLVGFTGAELSLVYSSGATYLVGDQVRSMGLLLSNQEFGLLAACLAPAFLVLALRPGQRRLLYGSTSLLLYVAVILSLTRTAVVASVLVGVLGLLAWAPGREVVLRTLAVITLIVSVSVSAYWLLLQIPNDRVQGALVRIGTMLDLANDGSANARQDRTYPKVLAYISANPLGYGAGSAGPVSGQFPTQSPLGLVNADNGYLMIAVQVGVAGAIVFALMLAVSGLWLARSGSAPAKAAAAALLALMIAMVLAGYWSLIAPITLVGALVGVGIASAGDDQEDKRPTKSRRRSSRGLDYKASP